MRTPPSRPTIRCPCTPTKPKINLFGNDEKDFDATPLTLIPLTKPTRNTDHHEIKIGNDVIHIYIDSIYKVSDSVERIKIKVKPKFFSDGNLEVSVHYTVPSHVTVKFFNVTVNRHKYATPAIINVIAVLPAETNILGAPIKQPKPKDDQPGLFDPIQEE